MWNGEYSYTEAMGLLPESKLDYYELHRIMSFANFQNEHLSALLLVNMGTKCQDDGQSVKCVSCKKDTSFNRETVEYITKHDLRMMLHHPYCSWREGYHQGNIPTTQEKEDEGREFLKELKSRYNTDILERKYQGMLARAKTTRDWQRTLPMTKALFRMCPCDICKSVYLMDNLRIAQTPPFRVNSVTNTMAGHLRDLMKREEESELVELIYQRQSVFKSDVCFVKTGIPGHSECISCHIEYRGDENGEDISVWHAQNAPYCPLLKMIQGPNFTHEQLSKLEDACQSVRPRACCMEVKEVEAIMNMCSNNPSNLDPRSAMDIMEVYISFFFENGYFPADEGASIIKKLDK